MPTPHGSTLCPSCHQPIRWAVTAAGRRQALNALADAAGNLGAYTDGTGRLRVRVLTAERPTLEGAEWRAMPHAASCTRPQPRRSVPRQRNGVRPAPWRGRTR